MSSNDIDALAQRIRFLDKVIEYEPYLERTGDGPVSGAAVEALTVIDEYLRLKPITKPTTYQESLQAREDLRQAKHLGELRDNLTQAIDEFTAETDAMDAGIDVAAVKAKGAESQEDDMPPGFYDDSNHDPADGR